MIQVNIERINAEKITEAIRKSIQYNTSLNITKVSEDAGRGWGLYDFKLNIITTPPAISFSINGKVRIQFSEKEKDFFKKEEKEKAAIIMNTVFPHLLSTVIILSRELQVPPPLPITLPQSNIKPKESEFRSI
jgi:hypothetical protein